MMSGRSSFTFELKILKIPVAQALKSCQSSFGAPSTSQMIGIG